MNDKKRSGRDLLKQLGLYVLFGGLTYAIFFVGMILSASVIVQQQNEEMPEGAFVPMQFFLFAVCAVFYFVPMFFLMFARNVGLKTDILKMTSAEQGGFSLGKVFREVYRSQGLADLAVYAVYAVLMLLPLGGVRDNPFVFVSMQQSFFYALPVWPIVSYLMAVAFFAGQYALCLLLVTRSWQKNRIRA